MIFQIKFLILLSFIIQSITVQLCKFQQYKLKNIIRGGYKNTLTFENNVIILRNLIDFQNGNNGILIRNNFYSSNIPSDYTYCYIGLSIIINYIQNVEQNRLVLKLYDDDLRCYQIAIYTIYEQMETKIYEDFCVQSYVKIKFSSQLVQGYKITNIGGNTYDLFLHIIKVWSYYEV